MFALVHARYVRLVVNGRRIAADGTAFDDWAKVAELRVYGLSAGFRF